MTRDVPQRPMRRALLSLGLGLLAFLLAFETAGAQQAGERWVATWTTALVARPQLPPPPIVAAPAVPSSATPTPPPPAPAPFLHLTNQTLRQVVHTTIAGSRVRIALSNAFGTAPLTIGAAHIALRDKQSTIAAASDRALMFSGRPTITIPSGALVYSDPVDLNVPAFADVAIDLYVPGETNRPSPVTMHAGAMQTSYVSETGNHAGGVNLPVVATTPSWFLLSRVEVIAPATTSAIVTFGDSITDGARSTPDTNRRWPDVLARRLAAAGAAKMAVLNAGIGGNRVLSEGAFNAGINALARFGRDVLDQTGVTHVIVMEGINDIGQARQNPTPTAQDLIAGHRQLIERAHTRGLKIYGATLTPFDGAAYFTQEGEAKRQALNEWIRTSKAYDGVIDFDQVTRDPAAPSKFLPKYDSGDHLHPSDAGYEAMGNAIDLGLFTAAVAPRSSGRQ